MKSAMNPRRARPPGPRAQEAIVELSVMEQRYQAVMAVVQDGGRWWRWRAGSWFPATMPPPRLEGGAQGQDVPLRVLEPGGPFTVGRGQHPVHGPEVRAEVVFLEHDSLGEQFGTRHVEVVDDLPRRRRLVGSGVL